MNTLHKERLWGILVFMKVIRPLFPKHSKHKTYRSVSVSKCTPVRTKALIAKKKRYKYRYSAYIMVYFSWTWMRHLSLL